MSHIKLDFGDLFQVQEKLENRQIHIIIVVLNRITPILLDTSSTHEKSVHAGETRLRRSSESRPISLTTIRRAGT